MKHIHILNQPFLLILKIRNTKKPTIHSQKRLTAVINSMITNVQGVAIGTIAVSVVTVAIAVGAVVLTIFVPFGAVTAFANALAAIFAGVADE